MAPLSAMVMSPSTRIGASPSGCTSLSSPGAKSSEFRRHLTTSYGTLSSSYKRGFSPKLSPLPYKLQNTNE